MVPATSLLAFALASIALIVIPGPSVLFVIGRSLALGRLGGLLSVLGNALGMLPLVIAVALGIGALVAQSAVAFTIVKIAGAAYLMYLGVQAIRHRRHTAVTHEATPPRRSRGLIIGEGFLVEHRPRLLRVGDDRRDRDLGEVCAGYGEQPLSRPPWSHVGTGSPAPVAMCAIAGPRNGGDTLAGRCFT